jgi:bacterial/archaeal transporter family-2 protein
MSARLLALFAVGIAAGALVAIQSVLNAALGKRAGELGSLFVLASISAVAVLPLLIVFPGAANLRNLPGPSQWYLYLGGIIGLLIVAAPIFLVPRIGATATLTAVVVGQLALAVAIDHFGLLGVPRSELTITRILGVLILALGTLLIVKK